MGLPGDHPFRWRGSGHLLASLITRYEYGLVPLLPMRGHLALDAYESSLLMAAPRLLGRSSGEARRVLATLGVAGAVVTSLTRTESPLEERAHLPAG